MSTFDFVLAGISGAIEPRSTGRLSGCSSTRRAAVPFRSVPVDPDDSSRGFPCPEPEPPA